MGYTDAVQALLGELAAQSLRPSTINRYQDALAAFQEHLKLHGVAELRGVRREHVESFQQKLLAKNYAPRTVRAWVYPVRRLFHRLCERGELFVSPAANVPQVPERNKKPRRLVTAAELTRLFAAPDLKTRLGIRERAMLETLYGTAMRLRELVRLDVADIDMGTGLAHIREGKGRKARVVPLGHESARWLATYMATSRTYWVRRRPKEPRLWVNNRGNEISVDSVHAMLTKLSRRARVTPSVYPHAFRYAAATHMMQRGADLLTIKELLGHKRIQTTQIYTLVASADVQATHARTHPLGS